MKNNFALACAAFVTAALMACSDEPNSNAVNPALDSYSSGVSDSDIYPPIDDPNLNDPTLNDPALNDPILNDPILNDSTLPGPINDPTQGNSAEIPNIPSITDETDSLIVLESSADEAPASSSDAVPVSSETAPVSSAAVPASSSSEIALDPTEKTYAFGYALKNAPRPSRGCGKNSSLVKTNSVENGDRFTMNVAGLNREYFITLPKNYDNTKPYKLLFAMHCLGSNAEDFVHHTPDFDHPTPYYGQQKLDTEGSYIFVAPRGDTQEPGAMWQAPWRGGDDKDHLFFDQLLTTMEDNYCIDTSRVFVTGFSFGSMFSYSLAEEFQERIRAVVTYAVADYNIYEPHSSGKEKQLPIAWMNVHGKNDGTCPYDKALNSALPRVLKKNGKASDGDSKFTDASSEKPQEVGSFGHVCYDFKQVDERFPVKWCSWNGSHQWTAFDNGDWQNTWVPEEVHKFFEQF